MGYVYAPHNAPLDPLFPILRVRIKEGRKRRKRQTNKNYGLRGTNLIADRLSVTATVGIPYRRSAQKNVLHKLVDKLHIDFWNRGGKNPNIMWTSHMEAPSSNSSSDTDIVSLFSTDRLETPARLSTSLCLWYWRFHNSVKNPPIFAYVITYMHFIPRTCGCLRRLWNMNEYAPPPKLSAHCGTINTPSRWNLIFGDRPRDLTWASPCFANFALRRPLLALGSRSSSGQGHNKSHTMNNRNECTLRHK